MYKQKILVFLCAWTFISCTSFPKEKNPTQPIADQVKIFDEPEEELIHENSVLNASSKIQTAQTNQTQNSQFIPTPQRPDNTVIQEMAQKIFIPRPDNDVTIHLKDDFEFNSETFFEDYKEAFGLGENDELRLIKIIGEEDRRSPRHNVVKKGYRFQQYYKNIPINNHRYQITYKERGPVKVSGNILEGLDLDVEPVISEQKALQIVMDSINVGSYCWQSGGDCPQAIPEGKLQIIDYPNIHLIYRFSNIQVAIGKPAFIGQVDAKSGEILFFRENKAH